MTEMKVNSFHELEMRWGAAAALHYLMEIEKAVKIPSWTLTTLDPETRFARACTLHDLVCANSNVSHSDAYTIAA